MTATPGTPARWGRALHRSLDSAHTDAELDRRTVLYVLMSGVGVALLLPLGVLAWRGGNPLLGIPDLVTATLLAANLAAALRTRRFRRHIALGVALMAGFFSYILATGGQGGTGFLWQYTFPLARTFLLGARRGALVAGAMLIPAGAVFALSDRVAGLAAYPGDLQLRFTASYLVVAVFAYAFEHYGEQTRRALAEARDRLEETVERRTRELAAANRELQAENTTRAEAEAQAEATRDLLQSVIDALPESLVVTLEDHTVALANRHSRERRGLTPDQPLPPGLTCYRLTHGRDAPCEGDALPCPLHEVLDSGQAAVVEHRDGDNGHRATLEVLAVPVSLPGEPRRAIVESCRDITARRKLEAELRQAHKMHAMGNLAGGVAHEFNNMLAAILGHAELAAGKLEPGSPAASHLDGVVQNSLRARDLVRQILTYSRAVPRRPQAGVELAAAVEEALALIRPSLPRSVTVALEVGDRPWVAAHLTDIQQVLMNLCANAAHAMGDRGTVTVRVDALPPEVAGRAGPGLLQVSDRGHGMDETTRERIFDPFFTTKEVGKGTGMGLAVVQGLVESLGGQIEVHTQPGSGTTFAVRLPQVEAQGEAVPAEAPATGAHPGRRRVLLVEDDPAVSTPLTEVLELAGYEVCAEDSAEAALRRLDADPRGVDLVLTDYSMPGTSGLELAVRLRDRHPGLPVVLCSGYSAALDRERLREAGVARLLGKPVRSAELYRTLEELLGAPPGAPAPASGEPAVEELPRA